MTTKLTREWLQDRIANMECYGVVGDEALILQAYRMALAAMDSEPVAYMTYKGYLLHAGDQKLAEYSEPMPLYADPRPASTPASPVAWDYEWASCITCEGPQNFNRVIEREAPPEWAVDEGQARNIIPLYRHAQPAMVVPEEKPMPNVSGVHAIDAVAAIAVVRDWNDCRAAMLQENAKSAGVSNNCRSNENVQVLQAGNSPAHSVLRPEQISGSPAQDGNSPVIPDGYVMVPKEPTKEMIDAGWLYFMGTKNPSSKGAYKAMLAAAPQEAK